MDTRQILWRGAKWVEQLNMSSKFDIMKNQIMPQKNKTFWHPSYLGGGFKYCLCSSLLGEDSHFD